MRFERLMVLAVLIVIFSSVAIAQTDQGEIAGFIKDDSGKVIIGATVVVNSPALLSQREIMSNDRGYYRIINLPPGLYRLTVSKEHYQTKEIAGISVRAGKTGSLNITLPVGEFSETITVEQTVPLIDTKSPSRSLNIDGDFVSRMPLNPNREWSEVWGLIPGVQFDGVHRPGDPNSINSIEVHGSTLFQNTTKVDGMNVSHVQGNLFAATFSTETIEDIQIVTSGFDASIDNSAGGYINIITKSGGNELSGSAVLTFQPEAWNWSNTEDGEAAKLTLYTPEASLGGPIFKDRTWFFTSYRYDNRDTKITRTEGDLMWFDINEIPRPTWSSKFYGHRFFAKVTHQLTDDQKLVVTYNYDKTTQEGLTGSIATRYADSAISKYLNGGPLFMAAHEGVWKDNFSTSLRVSYREGSNSSELISGQPGYRVRYGELFQFPGFTFGLPGTQVVYGEWEDTREENQTEIRGDASWYIDDFHGNHDIRFGFNGVPDSEYTVGLNIGRESYVEEGMGSDGVYRPYILSTTDVPERNDYLWYTRTVAGYVQDTWTLNERLTLNAGFRIQKDSDAVEAYDRPSYNYHLGFNYALTDDLSQSLRVSYSRRSDAISGTFSTNALFSSYGGYTEYYDFDLDGIWDDGFSTPYTPPARVTIGNYPAGQQPELAADDLGPSKIDQFQFGYTIALPHRLNFDAAFIYNISSDGFQEREVNWNIAEGGEFLGFNYPQWNFNLIEYGNDKWSSTHYHSLELMLSKEFSDGWQLITSYTYQDQTLKGTWSPYDPEYYYYDQSWFETNHFGNLPPHLLKMAANVVLPWDVSLSLNINSQAGAYLAPQTVSGAYWSEPRRVFLPDGTLAQNPFYRMQFLAGPRGADRDRLPWLTTVNIGAGKEFNFDKYRISATLQVFNLFNSGTDTRWNTASNQVDAQGNPVLPIPDYDLTVFPQSPRAAQLLLRVAF